MKRCKYNQYIGCRYDECSGCMCNSEEREKLKTEILRVFNELIQEEIEVKRKQVDAIASFLIDGDEESKEIVRDLLFNPERKPVIVKMHYETQKPENRRENPVKTCPYFKVESNFNNYRGCLYPKQETCDSFCVAFRMTHSNH